jgi:glycosyltransferase involved in cell wall biosynthesis
MKIIFLCGSLAPGQDGVGDYTLLLSVELIKHGHIAAIIALNDFDLQEEYSGYKETEVGRLPVFRLPNTLPEGWRFKRAKSWIDAYTPDWISLQFVPFSFNPKGLPVSFVFRLKRLLKKRRIHLMVHESWVGQYDGVKWKMLLLGILQRIIFKRLIARIDPMVIHTTTPFNVNRLNKLGFSSSALPLFSNIMPSSNSSSVVEIRTIRIVIFGQAANNKAITTFLQDFRISVTRENKKVEVVLIGYRKRSLEVLKNSIEQMEGFKNNVKFLGYMPTLELSKVLQTCALGLTPVPRHLIGKSGSVAAFIAHGLPVAAPYIYPGRDPEDIGFFSSNLCGAIVKTPDFSSLQMAAKASVSSKNEIEINKVTEKFIADLQLDCNNVDSVFTPYR